MPQVVHLCEILGKNVTQVVDEYVALSPVDEFRQVPVAFEEFCEEHLPFPHLSSRGEGTPKACQPS